MVICWGDHRGKASFPFINPVDVGEFDMSKLHKFTAVMVFSLYLVGCGGSSSGGGDDDSTTPTLPADATKITTANASAIAADAVSSVDLVGVIANANKGSQTETVFGTSEVLELIIEKAFNKSHRLSSVANKTETESCDSGSVTIDYEETGTSESGTLTFSDCEFGGITLDGFFEFSSNFDNTGDYSDTGSGRITVSDGSLDGTFVVNFSETGNDFTGSYSTTMSFSISGSPDFNYLLTTLVPITGIDPNVSGGQLKVAGADNSSLLLTVDSLNTIKVELDENGDGTYVFIEFISL
jgi:hypothetical protein